MSAPRPPSRHAPRPGSWRRAEEEEEEEEEEEMEEEEEREEMEEMEEKRGMLTGITWRT